MDRDHAEKAWLARGTQNRRLNATGELRFAAQQHLRSCGHVPAHSFKKSWDTNRGRTRAYWRPATSVGITSEWEPGCRQGAKAPMPSTVLVLERGLLSIHLLCRETTLAPRFLW